MSDQPKHIVIDARSRPSSTGRYVDRLMQHLQSIDAQNHYTVLVRPDDGWQPTAGNFSVLACAVKQFSFNPLDQITFGRYLARLKPDLVHFGMTPQEPAFYFGKRVTTTHDLTMLRFTRAGKLPGWLHAIRMVGYRLLLWLAHRQATRIIVPTQFVAQDIINYYPFAKNKVTVTLEASEPTMATKATPLQSVKKPFIMHTGSPFPHKNIERLVEAFGILKKQHPDLQLVLSGKKEKYFEKLAAGIPESLRASIIIPGFTSDSELAWLYENAEAYVLPSLSEGFGLPGLEAMAHGTPLVSSNATCLPELYEQAAYYFDPLDAADMARAIHEVLADEVLAQKLIKAGQGQVKKYSWRRMAEQTLGVYQEILAKQ